MAGKKIRPRAYEVRIKGARPLRLKLAPQERELVLTYIARRRRK